MVASSSGSMVTSGGTASGVHGAERQGEGPFGDRSRSLGCVAHQGRRVGHGAVLIGDDECGEPVEAAQEGADALRSLGVDEGHFGPGVLQPVAQLLTGPPGVEGHDDGAGQGDGPERHHPLGQVPHHDGDAVTLPDAEFVDQAVGQRAGDPVVLGERGPLVLVDEVGGVAVPEGQIEDGAAVTPGRSSTCGWGRPG